VHLYPYLVCICMPAFQDARYDRLIELNVQEQCVNVLKVPEVQYAFRKDELSMHGWVFDPRNGELVDLALDFPQILSKIMKIYQLEDPTQAA
jgi:carbonic anhydrase